MMGGELPSEYLPTWSSDTLLMQKTSLSDMDTQYGRCPDTRGFLVLCGSKDILQIFGWRCGVDVWVSSEMVSQLTRKAPEVSGAYPLPSSHGHGIVLSK